MKDLKVIILAAGDSTRMWPIKGKYGLNLLGKPLVYYQLTQLLRFGFSEVIIIVNQENADFFTKLKSNIPKLNIILVKQTLESGMAGAVLSAKNYILGKPVLILNQSDIFEDILLDDFLKITQMNPEGIITGTSMDTYYPGGYLTITDNNVISVIEKPNPKNLPSNIVKLVFDYFQNSSSFISALGQTRSLKDDRYEKALVSLLKNGKTFKFLHYKGFWGHLKYPWHILSISTYYLSQIKEQKIKNAKIENSANISGDVLIEDGVRIMENVKIIGPCYIGENTIIGQNCLIKESMIGQNSVIGFLSEISRSYIGNNCWFHNNFVGDSVILDNVSLGGGVMLANFRLDEKPIKSSVNGHNIETNRLKLGAIIGPNVRIGVNVSIMPGVKIGENSIVGPAVVLDGDLPDGNYCEIEKRNYIVKDNKVVVSDKFRREHSRDLRF